MTTTSGNVNSSQNNNQLANDYVNQMKANIAQATTLIAQLQGMVGNAQQLEAFAAILKQLFGSVPSQLQAAIDAQNKAIKGVEDQLSDLCGGMSAFDDAITAIENGTYTVIADGDGNLDEDFALFSQSLASIGRAIMDSVIAHQYGEKMDADGDDNSALEQDSIAAMKASSAENGELNDLQQTLSQALVVLNDQKNAAQTDLDSYHWWDDALSFGTDEEAKDEDRAIIRNSNDMRVILTNIMSALAPEIGASESVVYATASLALGKILDQLMKLLARTDISAASKGDQAKCLMAIALGILAEVQTDAAKLKAKDQQTESKAATFATQMNISDQKAQLAQLQEELHYASVMKTLMAVAKPLMEVGGMLLAPGVGSFVVMALLMIADEAGLTDKLTAALAKTALGQVGAEILVGAIEIAVTLTGGAVLDKVLEKATEVVAVVVAAEVATMVALLIKDTVEKIMQKGAEAGVKLSEEAVRKTVTEAVNKAVQTAAEKTVVQSSKQAAAKLLPALKAASEKETASVAAKETTTLTAKITEQGIASKASNFTRMVAQNAAPNAVEAAEGAAKIAAKDVEFLAEAAGSGAKVGPADIDAIGNRASNESLADLSGTSIKDIESSTAKQSTTNKIMSRVVAPAAYAAFNDGAISSFAEYELKKHGKTEDSDEFEKVMETIKIIESILASMSLMYGTGMFSSMSSMISGNSATLLMKVGTGVGMAGTAASTISTAGQADAEMEQADTVKAINESTVSNEMLNMFMQQFNQQGDIDRKNLENQMAEQASNYTMISHLEDSGKEAAQVLSVSAV
jgi:hypothetical protein